jgi:hypothetical protein
MVDRPPVHRSKKVRQWLQAPSATIPLFFLPGYSQEPNPDGLLNQEVKSNTIRKKRPSHQDELSKNVRGYLGKRQLKSHIVETYFLGKQVRYAAACYENR